MAIASLVAACAEVGAPPGGEVDQTGPTIVSLTPSNGATNVPITDRVVIQFSERIVAPRTGKAFFVSPRSESEPKIRWQGDRVVVIFPDSLQPDQTYIIALNSTIADLRGNRFDSTGTVAFSTGPTLDSGRVAGVVLSDGSMQAGLIAALYDSAIVSDSVIWDSLYPTYITQTNQQGQFRFDYLPDRTYRLIVFQDRNGNERFNPARESFALSDRPTFVGGPLAVTDLRLGVTTQDTTTPEILAASFTVDRLVRVRLSRPVSTSLLAVSPANLMLRPVGDSIIVAPAQTILEIAQEESATLTAWVGTLDTGLYRLELTYDPYRPALLWDTINIAYADDHNAPQIVDFVPTEAAHFLRDLDLHLRVSEPLDTSALTPETFVLWRDPDSTRLPLSWTWPDVFNLSFSAGDLREGQAYRLTATEFELKDRAGNVVGDSLREYRFSTYASDSLGSIAGSLRIELPGKTLNPVTLTFKAIGKTAAYTLRVDGDSFVIDVPAGDYQLSGFIDSDLDGELSLGSVAPFRYAETQAVYPDTIEVRARFETSGIDFIFR